MLTRILLFTALGLLFMALGCSESKSLKGKAEKMRVRNDVPGMAVAVVKADTILEMFTLGHRRSGHPDTIALGDRFHLGSNTKAMTAFVAANLIEKDSVEWSAKFIDLYPEWKTEIDSQYWSISLGDLLSHRGTIQKFWTEEEFDSVFIDKASLSSERQAFSKYALNKHPVETDSMGYCYSNAGYSIAALMLERVSGLSWEELMTDVFNDSLNLDIGFSWPNKKEEDQPWGHWTENGEVFPCPPDDDYDLNWIEPGGDVNISLPNYCKFIQLNLRGLTGEDNYLKASTYHFLHTDLRGPVYAYGWADFVKDGRSYSYHAGSAGTFLTDVLIDKDAPIAYIFMMNTNSPEARNMVVALREEMEKIYGVKDLNQTQ